MLSPMQLQKRLKRVRSLIQDVIFVKQLTPFSRITLKPHNEMAQKPEVITLTNDPMVEHHLAILNGSRYHYLFAEPVYAPKATVFLVSSPQEPNVLGFDPHWFCWIRYTDSWLARTLSCMALPDTDNLTDGLPRRRTGYDGIWTHGTNLSKTMQIHTLMTEPPGRSSRPQKIYVQNRSERHRWACSTIGHRKDYPWWAWLVREVCLGNVDRYADQSLGADLSYTAHAFGILSLYPTSSLLSLRISPQKRILAPSRIFPALYRNSHIKFSWLVA